MNFFPLANHRNVALYYLLTVTNRTSFVFGNWIFFWLRFMTFGQLGVIDALAFGYGLLAEIPTGAIGDLVGKKKTLLLAGGFNFVGIMLMSSAQNLTMLMIGFLITQTGFAFLSGASDAFIYETLKGINVQDQYDRVASTVTRIGMVTAIITVLLGGVLYNIHFRLPHYAWGFGWGIGFIITLFMTEPPLKTTDHFSVRAYIRQMWIGSRQLLLPALRPFLAMMLTISGLITIYTSGLISPAIAIHFGFDATDLAVIYAGLRIVGGIAVSFLPAFRRRFSDFRGLALITLMLGLAFFGAALPLGTFGIVVMLLFILAETFIHPWISVIVNDELPSEYRATSLSALALLSKLPYVLTAIIAGQLIENNMLWAFNFAMTALIGVVLLISLASAYARSTQPQHNLNYPLKPTEI